MFAGYGGFASEPGTGPVEEETEHAESQRAKVREIDPIRNPSDALLSAALNRLAKGSARQAPASVGARLAQEFHRHHVRRRRTRTAVISIAACLTLATAVAVTLMLWVDNAPPSIVKQPVPAVVPSLNPPTPDTAGKSTPVQDRKSTPSLRSARAATSSSGQSGFVTLGVFDPTMTPGDLKVVRLQLTGADLRLVGAPVAEDLSDRPLLADIVLASDGTPYAVRLVR
jgi:hypothetical protein